MAFPDSPGAVSKEVPIFSFKGPCDGCRLGGILNAKRYGTIPAAGSPGKCRGPYLIFYSGFVNLGPAKKFGARQKYNAPYKDVGFDGVDMAHGAVHMGSAAGNTEDETECDLFFPNARGARIVPEKRASTIPCPTVSFYLSAKLLLFPVDNERKRGRLWQLYRYVPFGSFLERREHISGPVA